MIATAEHDRRVIVSTATPHGELGATPRRPARAVLSGGERRAAHRVRSTRPAGFDATDEYCGAAGAGGLPSVCEEK